MSALGGTSGVQWVPAAELKAGDQVPERDGYLLEVAEVVADGANVIIRFIGGITAATITARRRASKKMPVWTPAAEAP